MNDDPSIQELVVDRVWFFLFIMLCAGIAIGWNLHVSWLKKKIHIGTAKIRNKTITILEFGGFRIAGGSERNVTAKKTELENLLGGRESNGDGRSRSSSLREGIS